MSDLRIAARTLLKHPGFTVVAALTLALRIGANTVVFSFVDGILLRPLPYPDPDRLLLVRDVQPSLSEAPMSYPEYLDWRGQDQLFSAVAAMSRLRFNFTGEGEPERLNGIRASASLLPMLGVKPAAGRLFTAEEESPAAPRVAVISHGLWQRRFAGDPRLVGRALTLDGEAVTAVGVLPPGFSFGDEADVWVPLRLDAERAPRGLHFLGVVARLRPGLDLAQARAEAEPIAAHLREEYKTDHGLKLVRLQESVVASARPLLLLLGGAVALVLLIACTNVASLLLARTAGRRREIAVRLSLGTTRGRLVRQLLTESTLLALLGGGLGLVLAGWGVEVLARAAADRLPRVAGVGLDWTVVAFTAGLAIATGFLFGLAPALQATRTDLQAILKEGGRGGDPGEGRQRLRAGLVIGEVALSLVLLIGAGLLIRSFQAVLRAPAGFRAEGLLSLDLNLPPARYPEAPQQEDFYRQLKERLGALPGVAGAAEVSHLPLSGRSTNGSFAIAGREWAEGERPLADKRLAGVSYFQVMGIPIVRGRAFDERDGEGAPQAAIVSESFARRFFPDQDPIGQRIDLAWHTDGFQEIVGVAGDVKHQGLDEPSLPAIYLAYRQQPALTLAMGRTLVIRAAGAPEAVMTALREQVAAIDRDLPISSLRPMDEVLERSLATRRLTTSLLSALAAIALTLAAVGLYGLISYLVTQRTQEIGIRMALGARRAHVLRQVVARGLVLALVGTGFGLAASFGLARLMTSQLYEVTATDPPTFAAVPAVLLAVALVASLLPAHRAARLDPMAAMRAE